MDRIREDEEEEEEEEEDEEEEEEEEEDSTDSSILPCSAPPTPCLPPLELTPLSLLLEVQEEMER